MSAGRGYRIVTTRRATAPAASATRSQNASFDVAFLSRYDATLLVKTFVL